jgi:hypothetical protein
MPASDHEPRGRVRIRPASPPLGSLNCAHSAEFDRFVRTAPRNVGYRRATLEEASRVRGFKSDLVRLNPAGPIGYGDRIS